MIRNTVRGDYGEDTNIDPIWIDVCGMDVVLLCSAKGEGAKAGNGKVNRVCFAVDITNCGNIVERTHVYIIGCCMDCFYLCFLCIFGSKGNESMDHYANHYLHFGELC